MQAVRLGGMIFGKDEVTSSSLVISSKNAIFRGLVVRKWRFSLPFLPKLTLTMTAFSTFFAESHVKRVSKFGIKIAVDILNIYRRNRRV